MLRDGGGLGMSTVWAWEVVERLDLGWSHKDLVAAGGHVQGQERS